MKNQFLTLLVLLICTSLGRCQNQEDMIFIKSHFGTEAKVFLTKKLSEYQNERIIRILAKDTIRSIYYKREPSNNILILTKEERKYINNRLDSLNNDQWYENLSLDNFIIIPQDTVDMIFEGKAVSGWQYFHSHYGLKLYQFSKPIFFRNNTLCFFYCGYNCDSLCGEGTLAVFKKEKNSWTKWLILYYWVS